MPHRKRLTLEAKECAIECMECADTCIQAIPHFVALEGEHLSRPHISLLNLCADICRVSSRTLLMGYEFHDHICGACAAICEACAVECEGLDEEFIQRCAKACRRCARSCRHLTGKKKRAA